MISRYNTFLGERLFESTVNESMIYYTKEFKDALYKLSTKNKIAKDLIGVEYTDVKPDMTFIGMSDKEGYFSFTQIKKAVKSIKDTIEKLAKETSIESDSDALKNLKKIYKKIEDGTTSQSDGQRGHRLSS
jgi:DNA-directed RNA polymerase delta subunit